MAARLIGKELIDGKKGKFGKLYFVEDFPKGKPKVDGMKCFEEFTDFDVDNYEVGMTYEINYTKDFTGKARFNGMDLVGE